MINRIILICCVLALILNLRADSIDDFIENFNHDDTIDNIEAVCAEVNENNAQAVLNAMCYLVVRPGKFTWDRSSEIYAERDRLAGKVAQRAIECGANVNAKINSQSHISLLLAAVGNGGFKIAEILANAGADMNCVDVNGWTAFYMAAFLNSNLKSRVSAMKAMLVRGTNPDYIPPNSTKSALYYAVMRKNYDLVEILLSFGASPDMFLGKRNGVRADGGSFSYSSMSEYVKNKGDERMMDIFNRFP